MIDYKPILQRAILNFLGDDVCNGDNGYYLSSIAKQFYMRPSILKDVMEEMVQDKKVVSYVDDGDSSPKFRLP